VTLAVAASSATTSAEPLDPSLPSSRSGAGAAPGSTVSTEQVTPSVTSATTSAESLDPSLPTFEDVLKGKGKGKQVVKFSSPGPNAMETMAL
jgi:hypothetical protein